MESGFLSYMDKSSTKLRHGHEKFPLLEDSFMEEGVVFYLHRSPLWMFGMLKALKRLRV